MEYFKKFLGFNKEEDKEEDPAKSGEEKDKSESESESAEKLKLEEERQVALHEQSKKEEEKRQAADFEQSKRVEEERQAALLEQSKKEEEERQAALFEQSIKEEEELQAAFLKRSRRVEEERQAALLKQSKQEEEERQAALLKQSKKEEEEKQAARLEQLKKEEEERQAARLEQLKKEVRIDVPKPEVNPDVDEEQSKFDPVAVRETILQSKINNLPRGRLRLVLDEDVDTIFDLGRELNFSKTEMTKIREHQSGGGQPNARFIDLILTKNFTIGDILENLEEIGNTEAYDILNDISQNKKYKEFCELSPKEAFKLHAPLYEDPTAVGLPSGWSALSSALGMDDVVDNIAAARIHGGVFSGATGFFKILNMQNPDISFIKEKLYNINEDGSIQKIIDSFELMMDQKVKTTIQKAKRAERDKKSREEKREEKAHKSQDQDFADGDLN